VAHFAHKPHYGCGRGHVSALNLGDLCIGQGDDGRRQRSEVHLRRLGEGSGQGERGRGQSALARTAAEGRLRPFRIKRHLALTRPRPERGPHYPACPRPLIFTLGERDYMKKEPVDG